MKIGKHARPAGSGLKGKLTLIAVAAACCALAVGGTLAYFNAEEKAHNVITSGGVEIELNEWADLDKTLPFQDVEGVVPGASVTKVVEVENAGASPAWIRVSAEKAAELAGGAAGAADVMSMDYNTAAWTDGGDGWWYYDQILPAGELTEPLFTTVSFDGPGMGNEYQGSQFAIDVLAQAVQSDNNSDSALTASGWPEA